MSTSWTWHTVGPTAPVASRVSVSSTEEIVQASRSAIEPQATHATPVETDKPFDITSDQAQSPSTTEANGGIILSLVGLTVVQIMPIFTFAMVTAGLLISIKTVRACRRGTALGHRRAMAGVVLGVLGLMFTVYMFYRFLTAS